MHFTTDMLTFPPANMSPPLAAVPRIDVKQANGRDKSAECASSKHTQTRAYSSVLSALSSESIVFDNKA